MHSCLGRVSAPSMKGKNMAIHYSESAKSDQTADILLPGVSLVRTAFFQNTTGATLATGTVIKMAPVPKGAMVTNIHVLWSGVSGVDLDVGDEDDADRYFDGLDMGTAAGQASLAGHANAAADYVLPFVYGKDDTIDAIIRTTAMPDKGYISMHVEYKMGDLLKGESQPVPAA